MLSPSSLPETPSFLRLSGVALLIALTAACNPTVRVEAPTEPIRIEANITINHEIKIVVEKDVEEVLAEDDLF
ncbi:YnbE family lipoprotein [Aliikangiella coralliicola]|uniref:YnbE family lipoprotein n=1 Tax=Aliikangiella coralliicola TaxID=2592383 RepID=A0A545UIB6_9GAMM|nr:YnbE family lipoprotein [Aliikangiella coralliicola]TQV89211.1 YnbE family lipoprotein [Aliikangiella coralliicola]